MQILLNHCAAHYLDKYITDKVMRYLCVDYHAASISPMEHAMRHHHLECLYILYKRGYSWAEPCSHYMYRWKWDIKKRYVHKKFLDHIKFDKRALMAVIRTAGLDFPLIRELVVKECLHNHDLDTIKVIYKNINEEIEIFKPMKYRYTRDILESIGSTILLFNKRLLIDVFMKEMACARCYEMRTYCFPHGNAIWETP